MNAEMLLVGTGLWRTTVTWSEASAWTELTTVDMFTFLLGLPCLGEEGGTLGFKKKKKKIIIFKGAACHSSNKRVGRTLRVEMKGTEMHTDICWQFSPPLKAKLSSRGTVLLSHPLIVP